MKVLVVEATGAAEEDEEGERTVEVVVVVVDVIVEVVAIVEAATPAINPVNSAPRFLVMISQIFRRGARSFLAVNRPLMALSMSRQPTARPLCGSRMHTTISESDAASHAM